MMLKYDERTDAIVCKLHQIGSNLKLRLQLPLKMSPDGYCEMVVGGQPRRYELGVPLATTSACKSQ